MTLAYVIILLASIILAPFASVRFANQIYIERSVPFLSTVNILEYSKTRKSELEKNFLRWLANMCDCYWCTSFISAAAVIIFMSYTPLRLVVIMYGLSELTIAMNRLLHKD